MAQIKISIIILNWNGWKDTIECLESLYQIAHPNCNEPYTDTSFQINLMDNCDVILVDNGSQDDSLVRIREYCEGRIKVDSNFFEYDSTNKPIEIIEYTKKETETGKEKNINLDTLSTNTKLILIKNEKNYGFAEGNNIAIRFALNTLNADYVLVLNNDIVVDPNFLIELFKVAENDKQIGFVGPKVYYYDYHGKRNVIHSAGAKINLNKGIAPPIGAKQIDNGQYDELKQVGYLEGACMLIKADVLRTIGLLDPIYFLYWEETDWCIRAKESNYKIIYVPKAKIWHKVGSGKTKSYYLARNRFIFMKKHANKRQLIVSLLYFIGFQFWLKSGTYLIYHHDSRSFVSFLKGICDGIKYTLKSD